MTVPLVLPADPVYKVLTYFRTTFLPSKFPTWTAGHDLPATPSKFIRVDWVGGDPVQTIANRERLRIQVFGDINSSDDKARVQVARSAAAHLWRDLNARRTSGVIDLPDPADPERQISQFTIEALLAGEQE